MIDVDEYARKPQRVSQDIFFNDFSFIAEPFPLALLCFQPEFRLIMGCIAGEMSVQIFHGLRVIVGVDHPGDVAKRMGHFIHGVAQQDGPVLIEQDPSGFIVPVPPGQVAGAQGQVGSLFRFSQRMLRSLQLLIGVIVYLLDLLPAGSRFTKNFILLFQLNEPFLVNFRHNTQTFGFF